MHYTLDPALEVKIARLRDLGPQEVRRLWRMRNRGGVPSTVDLALLRQQLAYALQEVRYGGLSHTSSKKLKRLFFSFCQNPHYRPRERIQLSIGTILTRTWRGRVYKVAVVEQGYQFGGRRYAGLSPIAERITGTRQSGWKFFGLNDAS